jgi:diguanylate cyclase
MKNNRLTVTDTTPLTFDADRVRIDLMQKFLSVFGFAAHLVFILLFFWLEVPFLAAFNLLSVAMWGSAILAVWKGRPRLGAQFYICELLLHGLVTVHWIGWNSGFHYYYILVPPLLFLLAAEESRRTIGLVAAVIFLYLLLFVYSLQHMPVVLLPDATLNWINGVNGATSLVALSVMSWAFQHGSITVERDTRKMAHTDPLTGLWNRRKMYELLQDHAKAFNIGRVQFALIMADIDHFKRINDTYGHDTGDLVLQHVTAILKENLREHDHIGRWGGEEFLILLGGADEQGALAAIDHLQTALRGTPLKHGEHVLTLTITFGVYTFGNEACANIDIALKSADEALYAGKNRGRNCVVMAPVSDSTTCSQTVH